jgi:hypothetical protein
MNVIDNTSCDDKQLAYGISSIQRLLLEVFHELWVQPNAQLVPECLLGGLARHDRVRYQPVHQKGDEVVYQCPWIFEDSH